MNRKIATLLILAFAASLHAAPPFRGQPMMAAAYENLEGALKKIERADGAGKSAPLEAAIVDLTLAKQSLDNAKKNKGANRSAAIKLIEEAIPLLEARPVAEDKLKAAKEKIMQAMDRVLQGARVGH